MGLDDFTDSSNSSAKTSSKEQKSNSKETIGTREHKQYGPYGYQTFKSYEDKVEQLDFKVNEGLIKFRMPIFPMITLDNVMQTNGNYQIKPMMKKYSCISSEKVNLHQIQRDIVMVDTGKTELEDCLNTLSERFGIEVTPKTEVWLNMLSHTRSVVKLALGNEATGDVSSHKTDEILKAVYGEAYTRRFRSNYVTDMKKHTEIKPW